MKGKLPSHLLRRFTPGVDSTLRSPPRDARGAARRSRVDAGMSPRTPTTLMPQSEMTDDFSEADGGLQESAASEHVSATLFIVSENVLDPVSCQNVSRTLCVVSKHFFDALYRVKTPLRHSVQCRSSRGPFRAAASPRSPRTAQCGRTEPGSVE